MGSISWEAASSSSLTLSCRMDAILAPKFFACCQPLYVSGGSYGAGDDRCHCLSAASSRYPCLWAHVSATAHSDRAWDDERSSPYDKQVRRGAPHDVASRCCLSPEIQMRLKRFLMHQAPKSVIVLRVWRGAGPARSYNASLKWGDWGEQPQFLERGVG